MGDDTPAPTYRVEPGEVACDRDAVLAVWRGNLGQSERMIAKFDWFYARCPFGEPLMRLLRHVPDDTIVGAASAGARRLQWQHADIRAGLLVDLAVCAEHRSLGPAMMLQGALAAAGRERFDLLYGFPNPKAAAVFKRVGYARLGDIVRHARVLRHAGYVRRRVPRLLAPLAGAVIDLAVHLRDRWRARSDRASDAAWATQSDQRLDTLWTASAKPDGLVAIRDAAFARWRFDESPLARTRFLFVTDRGERALRAWFACEAADGVLHVRDFWSHEAATGIDRADVAALVRAARRAGHAAVSVEYAGAQSKLAGWRANGFVERGRRPIFGKWCDDRPTADLDLHMTAADEDE